MAHGQLLQVLEVATPGCFGAYTTAGRTFVLTAPWYFGAWGTDCRTSVLAAVW